MWTGFPFVFAAIASTLSIPLTLVSLGIIARGSVFAFRKVSTLVLRQRLFGATFALSSLLTPFFLGTVAAPSPAAGCHQASPAVLLATLIALAVGGILLVPSL
jgi:cytochrome d ubiquinol oxidase subunit II